MAETAAENPQEMTPVKTVKQTPEEMAQQAREQLFQDIAATIREAAKKEKYVKLTELSEALKADKDFILALLDDMMSQAEYEDLRLYKGSKNRYYYSYPMLANNYVKNCALAEEDNLEGIIAEIVRYESKRYPRATMIDTFTRFPYHYTKIQVRNMLKRMADKEEYNDLRTYTSQNGNLYIYSTQSLTPRHAEALVEIEEDVRQWL